ncbi:MAG: DNRLRE domain-containing protein, partial [Deltaproteobacteria bacterium]|nr:DNRLRE domain-containing protein [Deltaproteobacteria bacterium]
MILLSGAGLVRVAQADIVTVGASQDNSMFSEAGDTENDLSNGAGFYLFAGATKDSQPGALVLRRALLAFDVAAAVPPGSTINSVTLTLYLSRARSVGDTVTLHRVLADWGEGTSDAPDEEGTGAPATTNDATWSHRFWPSTTWMNPGGDFDPTISASQTVGRDNGFVSWSSAQMTADVQGWLDTPASNAGWIVIGNEIGSRVAKRFNSREWTTASERPALEIDFTPLAETGACCALDGGCSVVLAPGDACTAPGEYQGDGTTCDPNLCPQPAGACCIPDVSATCVEQTSAACLAA